MTIASSYSSSSLNVFTVKNLSSFDGNWNDIFSNALSTYPKTWWNTLSHATAVRDSLAVREISFPQTIRAKTCREWKFLETIEKLGMGERVNRSSVLQARPTIYIQDRAWIKGVPTVTNRLVLWIFTSKSSADFTRAKFLNENLSRNKRHRSATTWNYLLQLDAWSSLIP